jgi:uncharacterized protein
MGEGSWSSNIGAKFKMATFDAEFLPGSGPTKNERTWAMLCHLSVVGQLFLPILMLGPLLIWLMKGDELPFVKQQGKEALNFQITLFLAGIVCWILVLAFGLGFLLMGILWVYSVVVGIVGAVKTNEGNAYQYGLNLRLIS